MPVAYSNYSQNRNYKKLTMKKTLLLSSILLALAASSSFADALLFTVNSTPYDRQMARIRPVLTASTHTSESQVSVTLVNQWMSDLRSIPYGFTTFWKTPAEAQSGAPADCKAKAVALYEKMRANGATNVRLVIGKRTAASRQTHAWLAWDTESGSYVLDPTFNWAACTSSQVGKRNYQPLYAYAGSKKFRAASALVAQN
ncbi:MAG: Bacterial transglutaminase-like cysteine proteinase [Verrucomicrobiota bacterium]